MNTPAPPEHPQQKSTLWQVVASALSAAFGVQSEQNRIRDFKTGSPKAFIIAGIGATVLFILTVYTIVRLVLAFAGQ